MSEKGLKRPDGEDAFFIGWSPDVSSVDRRFLLGAAGGFIAMGAAGAAGLAALQNGPGAGQWNPGAIEDWLGVVSADPYPLLRYREAGGAARTALLFCETKCGVRQRLTALSPGISRVRGSLLSRGRHRAIAVTSGADWISAVEEQRDEELLERPLPRALGQALLQGEVLDTKCWFGAMRPGAGKPHKACASLCIRHGVPPSMRVRGADGRDRSLLLTDANGAGIVPDEDFLALVADPVEVEGQLVAIGDIVTFQVEPNDIRRL